MMDDFPRIKLLLQRCHLVTEGLFEPGTQCWDRGIRQTRHRRHRPAGANAVAGHADRLAQLASLGSKSLALGALATVLGLKVAHAQEAEDPVTAEILRSAFFGSIVATTIVIAFALKYKSKAVRQRLDEIHKYRRALDPETVDKEKWKGFREFMRIEGSILASIAQFPLISPSIAVQYFVDRHMPSLGAGDHTVMRKVLNQTIYPNLRHFESQ